ncbi:acetyl-coenzyme A transporter 1-domain-containing protein [Pisolithus marmoratus]|nr:acetyl-coenzyme A transporter 1-domain-containing protein [Pisolithus marmoratus]
MSSPRKKTSAKRTPQLRHRTSNVAPDVMDPYVSRHKSAVASSLDSIVIPPRVPSTARPARESFDVVEGDEVELSLLDVSERPRTAEGPDDDDEVVTMKSKTISARDRRAMVLLVILYLIQGVPLGLALGSIPFILRDHLSYSQLGVFALSSYPYSLKLLWSPFVDSTFFSSIGRRKSWIIPMQLIIGSMMLYIAANANRLFEHPADNVYELTFVFTSLVFFSATQGWALTLLSKENLSFASTLPDNRIKFGLFCFIHRSQLLVYLPDRWGIPRLTLSGYLQSCSILCFAVTVWLIFFEKETFDSLIIMHCFAKVGFQANEAVTSLKMIEKGLGREDLAIVVLIDFPFQIVGSWLAAKWTAGNQPLRPWIWAFWPRLAFALLSTLIVFLVLHTVLQGFASTIQFNLRSLIGGTYMTLLNTFTNLGGTWPKYFVLKGVDYFTVAYCTVKDTDTELVVRAAECVSEFGKEQCSNIGGECVTEQDGYYYVSAICVIFGVFFFIGYIIPTAHRLQAMPIRRWRVGSEY